MIDKVKSPKYQNAIIYAEGLIVTILALFAIHDTVTATGAGYLIFLKSGLLTRTAWDILVDALVTIITCILIILPVRTYKVGMSEAVIFGMAGLSLDMPVRPDILITSFMGREGIGVPDSLNVLLSFLPSLCMAIAFTMLICFVSDEKISLDKYVWYAATSVVFLAASVAFASFREILVFASVYALLFPSVKKTENIKGHILPLSLVLFAASVWKLYFIMATYHV